MTALETVSYTPDKSSIRTVTDILRCSDEHAAELLTDAHFRRLEGNTVLTNPIILDTEKVAYSQTADGRGFSY